MDKTEAEESESDRRSVGLGREILSDFRRQSAQGVKKIRMYWPLSSRIPSRRLKKQQPEKSPVHVGRLSSPAVGLKWKTQTMTGVDDWDSEDAKEGVSSSAVNLVAGWR